MVTMLESPVVLVAVYVLAVARITGLITTDTLTEYPRDTVLSWLDDRPGTLGQWVGSLITCQWCASMYVSGAAVAVLWWHWDNPVVIAVASVLALSQAVGMMSGLGR